MTRLQIAQLAPQSVAQDLPERERLLGLAAQLDPEFVQLAYQIAVYGRQELALAPDEQAGFVMTLLRLYTFRPAVDSDATRYQKVSAAAPVLVNSAQRPEVPLSDSKVTVVAATVASERVDGTGAAVVPSGDEDRPLPEVIAGEQSLNDPAMPGGDWHTILAALKLGGMARELGQHCEMRTLDGTRIELCLAPAHRHLQMKPAQDKLQQSLSEYFGRSMQVTIRLEEAVGETPAATAQRRRDELQERAVASVEQDGFVREVIDIFDATVIESSIKPV